MPRKSHSRLGRTALEVTDMLADSMVVTTVAVTDLDQAKAFYRDRVGLQVLDEQPFAVRFGAGQGTQISVRRGQPNVGQTVGALGRLFPPGTKSRYLSVDRMEQRQDLQKVGRSHAEMFGICAWQEHPDE